MPYQSNEDLPASLRRKLPKHAQEIFRAAFNNAYEEYKDPSKRRNRRIPRYVVAYKVAWNAVKAKYHKNEKTGKWASA